MSDTTTETEDQGANVVLGDFGKPRRAHRRVRLIEDEDQAAEVAAEVVAAELPAPPAIVSIANSRRGTHLTRLKADLLAAEQVRWPMNPASGSAEIARLAAVREVAIADAARKLAEVEALEGWQLIHAYATDHAGTWRG